MRGCAASPVPLTAIAPPGPSTAPPLCPVSLQPIPSPRPDKDRGDHSPQPAGPAARPREGRWRGLTALQPPLSLGSCPRPAVSPGGEHVPFPCLPAGGFSSLQKSTHLLRRHGEGRNWLPAAVQGTRPAAGERRAPPAPARQHGLGRRRLLLLPWAFSG